MVVVEKRWAMVWPWILFPLKPHIRLWMTGQPFIQGVVIVARQKHNDAAVEHHVTPERLGSFDADKQRL
jgi:hypothetical protein